jgi:signal transduction histidine kinase
MSHLNSVQIGLDATKASMILRIDSCETSQQLQGILDHLCDCLKLWGALHYSQEGQDMACRVEKRAAELCRKYEDQGRFEWRNLVDRARIVDEFYRDEQAYRGAFPRN